MRERKLGSGNLRNEHPLPEGFYSNYDDGSVGLILASALQRKGIKGIVISDSAVDDRGTAIKGYKALFLFGEARKTYVALNFSPEMEALYKATNHHYHYSGEPQFDGVIPTFTENKRQRQLKAMYWDTELRLLRDMATRGTVLNKQIGQAEKRRDELLSPVLPWEKVSLPTQEEISAMVDEIVDQRLPFVKLAAKAS